MTVAPTATWHARVPFRSCPTCLIWLPHLVQLDLSSDPIAQNLKSHFRAALAGSLLQGHKSHTPCDVMLYILLHSIFKCTFDQQLHPVLQGGSNSDSIRPHCVAPFLGPDLTCQSYPHTALIKCPPASSRLNATGCHGRRTSSLR